MSPKQYLFFFTFSIFVFVVVMVWLDQSQGRTKPDRTVLQNSSVYEFETKRGDYCVLVSKSNVWGALQCDFKGG